MKTFLVGLMILMFTPAPLVYAQTGVQPGPEPPPGTTSPDSVKQTKEVAPKEQVVEKEVKTSGRKKGRATHKYSGVPPKRTRGVGNTGPKADLMKDTGPDLEYTVDRLPVGANPEEALWVKMRDGRMMMVDPEIVHNLPEKRGTWD